MRTSEAIELANKEYPDTDLLHEIKRKAFIKGYLAGCSKYDTTPKTFYQEVATKLREMWPPGEKDGKWPWRDSVGDLSRRLETLWRVKNLHDYTVEDCIMAAQRYLSQYRDNIKYMQTLKYFILKQSEIVDKDGKHRYYNESKLANFLEGNIKQDMAADWENVFESSDTINDGGRLV